jgi:hypothetical protein
VLRLRRGQLAGEPLRQALERGGGEIAGGVVAVRPLEQPPPARPADRVLTRDGADDGVAHAAERPAVRRDHGRDTFAAVNRFLVNGFWVLVAAGMAYVIWTLLWAPVLARQRRN